jgi:hypothetical protein
MTEESGMTMLREVALEVIAANDLARIKRDEEQARLIYMNFPSHYK